MTYNDVFLIIIFSSNIKRICYASSCHSTDNHLHKFILIRLVITTFMLILLFINKFLNLTGNLTKDHITITANTHNELIVGIQQHFYIATIFGAFLAVRSFKVSTYFQIPADFLSTVNMSTLNNSTSSIKNLLQHFAIVNLLNILAWDKTLAIFGIHLGIKQGL